MHEKINYENFCMARSLLESVLKLHKIKSRKMRLGNWGKHGNAPENSSCNFVYVKRAEFLSQTICLIIFHNLCCRAGFKMMRNDKSFKRGLFFNWKSFCRESLTRILIDKIIILVVHHRYRNSFTFYSALHLGEFV